jgi:UrcA family protein
MNTMTSHPRLRVFIATALCSALASGFSAVVTAADGADAPTAIVKYGDLNVSTVPGASALYGRIRSAAQTVCRFFDRRDLASQALKTDCINHAIARAVTEVNEPALFSVYNTNNRTPLQMTLLSQSH